MTPVLFVIDGLEFGGGERGFLQLARGLVTNGWPVGVAGHPGGVLERETRAAGATFHPIDMRARVGVRAIARLRQVVKDGGFRLVHSQGARGDFFTRIALLGLAGVRNVCTVQMPVEGFDVGPLRRVCYLALDRSSARRVDRFIVVSRALEGALVQGRGIAPARVSRIPNGIELDGDVSPRRREQAAAVLRARLALDADARVIGAVGRLVWQKGFEDLVRAMPAVLRQEPRAHLVIVGEGPRRAPIERAVDERGVAGRVLLPGFSRDVPEFLRAVEMLVIPSRREGFPMVTLEAMALGTPLVATAIDGVLEQVEHERDALVVPPGDVVALADAIARLLAEPALGGRLAGAARAKVAAAFDLEHVVEATRRLYLDVLADEAR